MNNNDKSHLEESTWSFCIDIDKQQTSEQHKAHKSVRLRATPIGEPPWDDSMPMWRRNLSTNFFPLLVSETDQHHGKLTLAFIKNAHVARSIGWVFMAPLYAFLFSAYGAHWGWIVAALCTTLIFPYMSTLTALRSKYPLRILNAYQIIETCLVVAFAEVVAFEPFLVAASLCILLLNSVISSGYRVGLLNMGTAAVFGAMVYGQWRSTGVPDSLIYVQASILLYLLCYLGIVAHRIRSMVILHGHDRRILRVQKQEIQGLHEHLIETIAQPFVSADDILELIRTTLSPKQLLHYRVRIQNRQQFESIGRRAGVVAHDVKNLLQPILLISDMLEDSLQHDAEALELLNDMNAATHQASELLLQLDRRSILGPKVDESCAPLDVIQVAINLLKQTTPTGITIDYTHTLRELGTLIPIGETPFHQVMMNLILNGVQAIDGTGVLSILVEPYDSGQEEAPLPPTLRAKQCIVVTVRDTGAGITPNIVSRIFEPYFTTKGHAGGTGLGLATTQAVVSDAGGVIRVQSKIGVGTQFRILLPAVSPV